jgi:hypothetical protein
MTVPFLSVSAAICAAVGFGEVMLGFKVGVALWNCNCNLFDGLVEME